jgi:acetyltransferase
MAADDRIVAAAFKKAGVIRVRETQDMSDLVRAFVRLPAMKGPRVAVVTLSGAGGIILLDTMEAHGLQPAQFQQGTLEGIQRLSPDWMPIGNPVDIWAAIMKNGIRKAYDTALRDVLSDPTVDGVICLALGLEDSEQQHLGAEEVIGQISEEFEKPIVVWVYGSQTDKALQNLECRGRALTVPTLEGAVRVLSGMLRYNSWKNAHNP